MTENGMSPADYAAISGNNRNGMFGGDGEWWIIILFLIICWGNNGWGGNGANGTNGSGFQGYATRADINEGFALNGIENGIRGIQQGLCDSTYALNNSIQQGFANTNMGMMQGFNGVERGFCNLSSQLANCCCENREAIAQVRYDMATQNCATNNNIQNAARDITDNANNNTRAILDFLTQDKISTLTAENQALKFAQSQTAQNQFITQVGSDIVNRLQPAPVPAYQVPNPYIYHANCGYNACCNGCAG